jgi:DNA-binding HxlR family transcriptional regulator
VLLKKQVTVRRRSYRQFCGVARALDIVGERWTLLIVRNLLLGPRRYGDLLAELPGITTNLLAKRLRELVLAGLVEKAMVEGAAPVARYALTAAGAALEPVVMELGRWGWRYMDAPKKGDAVDLAWGMLSLKRRYKGGESLVVEVDADGRAFELAFSPRYLAVTERASGAAPEGGRLGADVLVQGSTAAVRALLLGGASGSELRREGAITVRGREIAWHRFLAAFEPPKAEVTSNDPASSPRRSQTAAAGRLRRSRWWALVR